MRGRALLAEEESRSWEAGANGLEKAVRALETAGRSSLKLETCITFLNHFLPLGEK